MGYVSPYRLVKQLERQVLGGLSSVDEADIPTSGQQAIRELRRALTDARLDIRDYELSETREAQLELRKDARNRLLGVRQGILQASEYNIFNAVDVAHLSAIVEQVEAYVE